MLVKASNFMALEAKESPDLKLQLQILAQTQENFPKTQPKDI
mgnify:CR=1 FL=1